MIDSSMLPDFIVEAAEHLEEMESSLLRLEQDYEDKEVMDEIFRSIHTIKGAAQFVGIERVSELSHKLENLLDLIRRHEITLNTAITDLLIAGKDRLTLLVDELERTQAEETEVTDLVEQVRRVVEGDDEAGEDEADQNEAIASAVASAEDELHHEEPDEGQSGLLTEENMSDEYDEELYNIFLQQLKENIPFLYAQTVELSISVDKQDVLYRCSDSIKSLKSSANYMGYEKLTQHYSNWQHAIENAVEQLSSGKMPNLAFMQDYLDDIIRSFPQAMEGYSQDDADTLGDSSGEEKHDSASIDSALNSIFADDEPAATSDDSGDVHEGLSGDISAQEKGEKQGIDLDRALDSIFSDEHSDTPETGGESADILSLESETSSEDDSFVPAIMNEDPSFIDEAGGADAVPLEYEFSDDEYDEELISIFLKKLKTDIQYIQARIAEYSAGGDKRTILVDCQDAIGRLASSANYMEYVSLTEFCETWESVVEGYLADISAGVASDITAGLQEFVDKVVDVYPQIIESDQQKNSEAFSDAIDGSKENDNMFSVSGELLAGSGSTSRESGTSDTISAESKRAAEKTTTHTDTDTDTEYEHEGTEDKALFDKLSSALDVSEYSSGTSKDSIDSVIEEIMEAPGQEDEHVEEIKTDSGMISPDTFYDTTSNSKRKSSGAHLLDKVVASNKKDEIEIPASDGETDQTYEVNDLDTQDEAVAEAVTTEDHEESAFVEDQVDFGQAEIFDQKAPQEENEQAPAKKAAVRSSIRVDAEKIDYLMNQVGELVVSRAYFAQLVNEMRGLEQLLFESSGISKSQLKPLHEFAFRLSEAGVHLGRVSNELQEGVMKVRMLPIDQLFKRYPRLVRDLIHNQNKDVKLITKGEETELDKMVIESISDPLIHIIRNSVDHGIETEEERLRAGKPAQGSLVLEAFHESDHIVLEITDDGRGIDTQRIRAKALEKGLVRREELERMSDQELTRLIMLPGFSTAEKATKTSGRGVGMDVVKKNIEKLNGTVEIVSEKGRGTRLRIKIPLTMAIIQALMVRVGLEKFTIPLTTVEETLRVFRHEISEIEGVDVIHLRESTMPIFQLSKIYDIDRQGQDEEKMFVVVVSTGTQELGLVVDELLGQEEVVIKPLADYLRVESGFGGATILGDGGISLILDIPELVKIAKENQVVRQEQRSMSFKRKKGRVEETQTVH
ncbi:MAG: chemotaxis protein CheW [Candidatus Electrothrix sp. Rat3]|nr:chemotaxis protein CheW [Candidatus Electrothrix rattekaaiensis]